MKNIEGYISLIRNSNTRRAASAFLTYLAVSAVSTVAAYLYFLVLGSNLRYAIVESSTTAADLMGSQMNNAIEALILFAAVFTVGYRWIAPILCAWRGACLGCATYILRMDNLIGASAGYRWSLAAYFASIFAFLALSAVSLVYSDAICASHTAGEKAEKRALIIEYAKVFLILSGAIFIFGCLTVVLI